ncbi:MAG: porin [Pseudomonadota bacterium]
MIQKWAGVLCGVLVLVCAAVSQGSTEVSSDELLKILKEKKVISEEDIIKAKAVEGKKAEVMVKAGTKPKSINLKGRVQVRYTSVENGDLRNVTSQNSFDQSEFDGFSIRRMRLQIYGEAVDQWEYAIHLSADGDHNTDRIDPASADYELKKDEVGVKVQDAYINYNPDPYFNVVFGQFKSRFSPSYLTGGTVLPLCERPLAVDKIARKRETGISIESSLKGELDGRGHGAKQYDKPVFYAVGLYNGNSYNQMRNDNENMMLTGMLVYRPLQYINFGASYAYDQVGYDSETTSLGSATISNGKYVFNVKDGTVGTRLNIWDFNSAIDAGPAHIQIEYVQQRGECVRQYGYGVEGEYDLTDYFQLTARYDEFDPNMDTDNSLDSVWYTVGCNWFLHKHDVKWQLNYSIRNEKYGEEEDNNALVSHFQILF